FSSRRRHTRSYGDWSSDVCSSDLALTETGSLVIASASGSQLPGYAGGAARAIWIVGAQKVVPDLSTALHRVEEHCLPLESARAQIGRASGRERSGRPGGRGWIKKK